jgi:hypothetical protein
MRKKQITHSTTRSIIDDDSTDPSSDDIFAFLPSETKARREGREIAELIHQQPRDLCQDY